MKAAVPQRHPFGCVEPAPAPSYPAGTILAQERAARGESLCDRGASPLALLSIPWCDAVVSVAATRRPASASPWPQHGGQAAATRCLVERRDLLFWSGAHGARKLQPREEGPRPRAGGGRWRAVFAKTSGGVLERSARGGTLGPLLPRRSGKRSCKYAEWISVPERWPLGQRRAQAGAGAIVWRRSGRIFYGYLLLKPRGRACWLGGCRSNSMLCVRVPYLLNRVCAAGSVVLF